MADRIAVMNVGKALQVGRPDDIYERPRNRFVADFIGETNFVPGTLFAREGDFGVVALPGDLRLEAALRDPDTAVGQGVTLAIRPEKIMLRPATETAPPANGITELAAVIHEVHYIGTDTRYHLRLGDGIDLIARVQNQERGFDDMLPTGTEVRAGWHRRHASILSD